MKYLTPIIRALHARQASLCATRVCVQIARIVHSVPAHANGLLGHPAPDVLLVGDGLKMTNIHAISVSARMVKLKALWYRTNLQGIRQYVSKPLPSFVTDSPIPAGILPPGPYNTIAAYRRAGAKPVANGQQARG